MDRSKTDYQIKFFNRLGQYIYQGLSLRTSLDAIAEEFDGKEREEVNEINKKIQEGQNFSRIFKELEYDKGAVALVRAGEVGGVLDKTLPKAVKHLKDTRKRSIDEEATTYELLFNLFNSGIPGMFVFECAIDYIQNPKLKKAFVTVRKDYGNGGVMSESIKKFPSVFNHPIDTFIKAGEETGTLDHSFMQIAEYLRSEAEK